jgi:hypothetical protein
MRVELRFHYFASSLTPSKSSYIPDLRNRESTSHRLVHVINFETTDTQQDAAEGAKEAYELLQIVRPSL